MPTYVLLREMLDEAADECGLANAWRAMHQHQQRGCLLTASLHNRRCSSMHQQHRFSMFESLDSGSLQHTMQHLIHAPAGESCCASAWLAGLE